MKATSLLYGLALAGGVVCTASGSAQTPRVEFPAASPACTLKQRIGLTDIEVKYSRPGMKGREIYGGIVPYGQVWRTGANQSTKLSFSTPVQLDGVTVPAGAYALYTIPNKNEWTIILSKNTHLWGAFGYNPKDDLTRFKVKPVPLAEPVETFTIGINDIRDQSATLDLDWAKTRVPIPIQLDLVGKIVPRIEAAMSAPGRKSDGFYFQAAQFYYDHGLDLNKALQWVNAGLADQPRIAYEMLHLKAEILAKLGDQAGAVAAARQSTKLALQAEGPASSFPAMNRHLISRLQQ